MYTPPHQRPRRAPSPPLSVAGSSQFTTTPQPKLNVVARLAIEGKAKHADDGATIRMYLKLSIPMDSVSLGSTVPLFPEENLKLLAAQVHPLDIHSAPYNFSSTSFPLLNNAARALHLPALSQKSYLSVFGMPTPVSSTMHSSRTASPTTSSSAHNTPPLDDKYTGHIIVSGYNISYILPKEFPPRFHGGDNVLRVSRRPSLTERNSMHFMAAIELWTPYASRPLKAPFLIVIPVPRCLSNNIKLRIYPPTTTSASSSMASLSSADEDPGAWELASEPHVTRTPSRSGSSAEMADDESSDSSAYTDGSSGAILVRGSFPSTERLRIRWAQPTKNIANSDGRRRVGVKEAKGEMTTVVLGKAQDPSGGREGILMRLEYKGTCKGIWFPGVATMLGMDIGLEVKGADVIWSPGEDTKWTVTGGTGYTGFDVGLPSTPVSRQPSLEFPPGTSSMLYASPLTTRQDSSSSTSSLLRAPLPSNHLPDYSFEGSPTSLTPSVTLSSVSSLPLTPEGRSRASSDVVASRQSPAVPITIHINMNDITPPSKNIFTFSITATVLILPRHRPHLMNEHDLDSDPDINPIVLPRFCVLAADSETVSTIIRNESEGSTVEVYYISGDLRDAQTRKTVLQLNAINRCGNDGARIALRPLSRTAVLQRGGEQVIDNSRLSPRYSPLNGNKTTLNPLQLAPVHAGIVRRKRDGPLMISFVDVIATPLHLNGTSCPDAHAVRVRMHAPSDTDSEWLECGLSQVTSSIPEGVGQEYQVDIVNVSIDGVPVRFESSAFAERDKKPVIDLVPSYDEKPRNHWITWIKVHVGDQGGLVAMDYVVNKIRNAKDLKRNTKGKMNFDILIPTFALPVGRLEVKVETSIDIVTLQSNFAHQQKCPDGYRLLHYSLDQFFTPSLSLIVGRGNSRIRMGCLPLGNLFLLFLWIFPAILVSILLINLGTEFQHMRQSLDRFAVHQFDHGNTPLPPAETVFITTTVFPPSPSATIEANDANVQTTTALYTPSVSAIMAASTDPTLSTSSTGDQSQTDTTTFPSVPTPSSSPRLGENALIFPIPALPFEWSKIRVDFSPAARKTVDRVLEGVGIVWQIFRKVYHYPLDPP